ncbi:uncharacterized protein LOC119677234 [Teleopsis dalmanni]|uniref:uncharacterized protein LOC119677234 n=1 Tax=Teleopsis dalmanni TaxID=139649 RepID=UPI0018CE07FB|nr:uncharacterized protein LOC119677234 [Teleopsis dalmanni]
MTIEHNSYEEVLRNENPSRTIVNSETNIKLKPLELKKFDGNLENWIPFWEQFKQAIHENSKLDAASKFNYLSDSLVGKAAAAMTGFLPTERCYDDAIELLLEEYGDSDKIVDKYIQKLLNIRAINSASDVKSLKILYNEVRATMRTLSALCISPTQYNIMVHSILLKALPVSMRINFYKTQKGSSHSTNASRTRLNESERALEQNCDNLEALLEYIKVDIEALETAQIVERDNKKFEEKRISEHKPRGTAVGLHASYVANQIKHLTIMCEKKHLKENRKIQENESSDKTNIVEQVIGNKQMTSSLNAMKAEDNQIYLQTVKAIIVNKNNNTEVLSRCIMDNGSQRTYITEELVNNLNMPVIGYEEFKILGFGELNENKSAKRFKQVLFHIKSQYYDKDIEISATVVPQICSDFLPVPNVQGKKYKFIENKLAEKIIVSKQILSGINLLIGQDNYWIFNTHKVKRITDSLTDSLTAVDTYFGWTIQGGKGTKNCVNYNFNIIETDKDFNLTKFWDLEAIGIINNDDTAISNTVTSIKKIDGRYTINLPWKLEKSKLNNNKINAESVSIYATVQLSTKM